ncbi:hypothetical protein AB9P05_23985 [Roseivirga sp. BDSF3-8]
MSEAEAKDDYGEKGRFSLKSSFSGEEPYSKSTKTSPCLQG